MACTALTSVGLVILAQLLFGESAAENSNRMGAIFGTHALAHWSVRHHLYSFCTGGLFSGYEESICCVNMSCGFESEF